MTVKHEDDKIIAFERAGCFFVFNFHHSKSFESYRLGINNSGKYKIVLNTDIAEFGGHGRIDMKSEYFTTEVAWHDRKHSFLAYLPSRTGLIFVKQD